MYRQVIQTLILGSSSYALYLSATAGILLNEYKSMSRKAAKISSTASQETAQTERTVGLSVLTSAFSLASLLYTHLRPGWTGYVALFNTFLASLCYKIVQAYWTPEHRSAVGKLPGTSDYVVAWGKMVTLKSIAMGLGALWCLLTMVST